MSLGQYLCDRLGALQLDCPVLPPPACAKAHAGGGDGNERGDRDRGAPQAPDPAAAAATDDLAAVAVLSNN